MVARPTRSAAAVEGVDVAAFTIPTDAPEQDGTFDWDSTTIVVCRVHAAGETGLGYTYGDTAVATLIDGTLSGVLRGCDAMEVGAAWEAMSRALRNIGRPGVGMMAVSAVDVALWDLKARLTGLALATLLDTTHDAVPVYGSGGFTSYSLERLCEQLGGWVDQGIPRVKMKVGRNPGSDAARLDAVRGAIDPDTELYVDANGALGRKEAVAWAWRFAEQWGVTWFEEPVSSDDVKGLRLVRDHGPPGLDIAAGEYGYLLPDFARLAGAVDCLQADVTRCGGITGLMRAAVVASEHGLDVSGHCAPAVSAHALAAIPNLRHLEYFHDHVRVESMLFDGVLEPVDGALRPDTSRPGLGLELKRADAERWAA
jgi:L-alanine-DL-glutamate epimerase-like enolase superfamily enzyme